MLPLLIFFATSLMAIDLIAGAPGRTAYVASARVSSGGVEVSNTRGLILFRGIFFGEGPAAQPLRAFWGSARTSEEKRDVVSRVELHIARSEPSYFLTLSQAVIDGDRVALSATIERGAALIKDALAESPIPGKQSSHSLTGAKVIEACLFVYCHVVVMEPQQQGSAAQATSRGGSKLSRASGALRHERLVNLIANQLSPRERDAAKKGRSS